MFSQGRTQMSFILLAEFPMLKKKKCIHIWFNFARHYTHPSETMPFIEILLVVGKCHPHLGRASAVLEPASQWRPRLEVTQLPRSVLLSAPRMADPTRLLSTIGFFLTARASNFARGNGLAFSCISVYPGKTNVVLHAVTHAEGARS